MPCEVLGVVVRIPLSVFGEKILPMIPIWTDTFRVCGTEEIRQLSCTSSMANALDHPPDPCMSHHVSASGVVFISVTSDPTTVRLRFNVPTTPLATRTSSYLNWSRRPQPMPSRPLHHSAPAHIYSASSPRKENCAGEDGCRLAIAN